MRGALLSCVVLLALIGAAPGPASAQSGAPETAAQNVRQSQQCEQLVCSNPAFRERRMREECGPINDAQLRQSCLASFDCGSGAPQGHNWRSPPASERVR
jgi:hypothetical protein